LIGAVVVAAMTWFAGAICQQGAVVERLPAGRLLAVQFAGSAANHILPAGIGVATVNLRFLRNRGLSRSSAVNAVALNTCAGITVHLVALTVLVSAGLTALRAPIRTDLIALIVVTVLAGVGLGAAIAPGLRRRGVMAIRAQVRSAAAQWAIVGRRPARAVQLWTGSAAVPVLHAITLALIIRALGAPIGVGAVFGVYFLASTVSSAVPSPGGFGALDASLTVGLSADGLTTAVAIAAVLAYRLITVWLPLIPSACLLGILRRLSVL
jgi:glycosyltransferase 2 family protein